MRIRFVTHNTYKAKEVEAILKVVPVVAADEELHELQTENTDLLVKDKALKAFEILGEPVFVEHTGLYLDDLNGLPGGLTETFWNRLGKQTFADLFGDSALSAKTFIGYIDGKKFHTFTGEIRGTVASSPRVDHGFQWDCVFIPEGETQAFSEMGTRKNDISMRRKALDQLAEHLKAKL